VFFLYFLLTLICFLMIVTILIQSPKGGGLAGTFGGNAAASQLFGGAGAGGFLAKVTTGLAITFTILIIIINLLNKGGSLAQNSSFQKELQESMIVPGTEFQPPAATIPGEAGTEKPAQNASTPGEQPTNE